MLLIVLIYAENCTYLNRENYLRKEEHDIDLSEGRLLLHIFKVKYFLMNVEKSMSWWYSWYDITLFVTVRQHEMLP